MSQLKVNVIRHTSASSDAIELATDGTCTVKATNRSSNLIINGSCIVAQRSTSSTTSGYGSVDRFKVAFSGTDEAITHSQVAVASGTTPYTSGFRKALKLTNGNQTSGAGTGDDVKIEYGIEAQDIANSGWNYTSASSYITLSFWVKSSVAQNFYGYIQTHDGTGQRYPFETGSLSADTWTKITKSIPGNSNITVDDNNEKGLTIVLSQFLGTDQTASTSLNTWAAWNSGARTPDQTSTWYTTNDATFEITGLQLEVGDVATDFEHRSYGDELLRCQRYFWKLTSDSNNDGLWFLMGYNASNRMAVIPHPVVMRANPTITQSINGSAVTGPYNPSTIRTIFYNGQAYDAAANTNFNQFEASSEL